MIIKEYVPDINHIPGTENVVADLLRRPHMANTVKNVQELYDIHIDKIKQYIHDECPLDIGLITQA